METIYFAKLRPEARIPQKREEDAGYDIYACLERDFLRIEPLTTVLVPTGICSAFSSDYYFQLQERGSTGTKGMARRAGVIDSGFRGEWKVALTNVNHRPLYIAKPEVFARLQEREADGEILLYSTEKAIAQALFLPVPRTEIRELSPEELLSIPSLRGEGMLGSSGK